MIVQTSIFQSLKFPKILSWVLVSMGILGLIGIRGLEDKLFYDPFLHYFKTADQNEVFPDFVWAKLIVSYLLRFSLNTFFSLLIIHSIFQNKEWTKQALVLMGLVFAIVFPIYLYCIYDKFDFGYLFSFYVRRFVIQPLTAILLIPIFYYRKKLIQN